MTSVTDNGDNVVRNSKSGKTNVNDFVIVLTRGIASVHFVFLSIQVRRYMKTGGEVSYKNDGGRGPTMSI